MSEHDDVLRLVRESFSEVRMDLPVERVFAASRARRRRRRRLSGMVAAAAAMAGAVVVMSALGVPAPAPARSGSPPPSSLSPAGLAAFVVTSGPGQSTTLILHKGPQYPQLDPAALRQALAEHGIAALVTVGEFCRSTPGADDSQVVRASTLPDGSDAMVVDGPAMPPGTRLSIGYFPSYIRMALLANGAPLNCTSTSSQSAAHATPSGTAIRETG